MPTAKSSPKNIAGVPALLILALLIGFCAPAGSALAQGTDIGKPWLFGEGAACDARLVPWSSVWFGHFSGGLAYYRRGAPEIQLIWEDRKLCFPSQRSCMAWQRSQRRVFHRIEGYWTCLRLR